MTDTIKIEIKHRRTDAVLFAADVALSIGERFRIKAALEIAAKSWADLPGAYLSRAYLSGADLSGADLPRAYLSGADLSGANLPRAYLSGADLSGANLSGADLSGADLSGADLSGANLSGANLSGANLSGADLSGADLSGANLSGANLSGANLSGAKGVIRERAIPLLMLLDQPGPIRAYKVVNESGHGHIHGGIRYDMGQTYDEPRASTDVTEECGAGLHVATLDWCIREWQPGFRILVVEFTATDIACIPTATDGKFRLRRLTVVGEKDLVALGLVEAPKLEAA